MQRDAQHARHGTLCAWAKLIGKPQIARLLHETLEEERNANALLGKIADHSVNQHAQRVTPIVLVTKASPLIGPLRKATVWMWNRIIPNTLSRETGIGG